MSDLTESAEKASGKALEAGFTVYRSEPHLLLLDLDDHAALERFHKLFPWFQEKFPAAFIEDFWTSKSGNFHYIVSLGTSLPIEERLILQAALGSDPKREILAVFRLHEGIDEPSLLFRPPPKKESHG